jgi:hypothetical protein
MKKIGIIKSILNDELVLVEANIPLVEGDRLLVYVVLKSEAIKQETGLESLSIPKGELVVKNKQADQIYLAATAIFEPQRRLTIEHPIGASLAASISGLGFKHKEIVESIPKTNPVPIDKSQSLNIKYKKEVTVGDAIAKKEGF